MNRERYRRRWRLPAMSLVFAFVLSLWFFTSPAAAAPETVKASKIGSITVYADRALVTRVVNADLKKGNSTVVLEDLPTTVARDSIRVSGESKEEVTILSIKSEIVKLVDVDDAKVKSLQATLNDLYAKDKAHVDELNVLKEELAFYRSIRIDPSVRIPEGEKTQISTEKD